MITVLDMAKNYANFVRSEIQATKNQRDQHSAKIDDLSNHLLECETAIQFEESKIVVEQPMEGG